MLFFLRHLWRHPPFHPPETGPSEIWAPCHAEETSLEGDRYLSLTCPPPAECGEDRGRGRGNGRGGEERRERERKGGNWLISPSCVAYSLCVSIQPMIEEGARGFYLGKSCNLRVHVRNSDGAPLLLSTNLLTHCLPVLDLSLAIMQFLSHETTPLITTHFDKRCRILHRPVCVYPSLSASLPALFAAVPWSSLPPPLSPSPSPPAYQHAPQTPPAAVKWQWCNDDVTHIGDTQHTPPGQLLVES